MLVIRGGGFIQGFFSWGGMPENHNYVADRVREGSLWGGVIGITNIGVQSCVINVNKYLA